MEASARSARLAGPLGVRLSEGPWLWAFTLLLLVAWTAAVVAGVSRIEPSLAPRVNTLLLAPLVVGLFVLLSRPHSRTQLKLALAWTVTVTIAVKTPSEVGADYLIAVAPILVAAAAAVALRWPAPTLVFTIFLTGFVNFLEVFTPVEPGPTADLLLGGCWCALAYSWMTGLREFPRALPASLVMVGVYLALTVGYAVVAEDSTRALYSFRISAWFMSAILLVPLVLGEERRREWLQRGLLVVGALVGAYAMFRWVVGPSSRESAVPLERAGSNLTDVGELKLFGSQRSPHGLGFWCALMVPFALASLLAPLQAKWRLLAAFVAGTCGAAIFGADIRTNMVAMAVGALTVLILFAIGRGFVGRRVAPLAVAVLLVALGSGIFVSQKLGAEGTSGERFRSLITDPINDFSVQDRIVKWKTTLDDIERHPFGHGLGASGGAEKKYARFTSIATHNPDSAYVKVAYDQGIPVLLFFGAVVAGLGLALARRALDATDPRAAALALGACGTHIAFAVAMFAGIYFEGLPALLGWTIVGLGFAPFVARPPPAPGRT